MGRITTFFFLKKNTRKTSFKVVKNTKASLEIHEWQRNYVLEVRTYNKALFRLSIAASSLWFYMYFLSVHGLELDGAKGEFAEGWKLDILINWQ